MIFGDRCLKIKKYQYGQESGSRVVFGKNKHSKPPPVNQRKIAGIKLK